MWQLCPRRHVFCHSELSIKSRPCCTQGKIAVRVMYRQFNYAEIHILLCNILLCGLFISTIVPKETYAMDIGFSHCSIFKQVSS